MAFETPAAVGRRLHRPAPGKAPDAMAEARTPEWIAVTREVRVTVRTYYLADQSEPGRGHYAWAYRGHHRQ